MSERHTQTAVEEMRKEAQTQVEQNRVGQQRQTEETKQTVGKIAIGLEELTKQLNALKPTSATSIGDVQKQVSEQFQQRLTLQLNHMDLLSENIGKQ